MTEIDLSYTSTSPYDADLIPEEALKNTLDKFLKYYLLVGGFPLKNACTNVKWQEKPIEETSIRRSGHSRPYGVHDPLPRNPVDKS